MGMPDTAYIAFLFLFPCLLVVHGMSDTAYIAFLCLFFLHGAQGVQDTLLLASRWPNPAPLQRSTHMNGSSLCSVDAQVYKTEYDLFLASDLNDRSEGGNLCQWFLSLFF